VAERRGRLSRPTRGKPIRRGQKSRRDTQAQRRSRVTLSQEAVAAMKGRPTDCCFVRDPTVLALDSD